SRSRASASARSRRRRCESSNTPCGRGSSKASSTPSGTSEDHGPGDKPGPFAFEDQSKQKGTASVNETISKLVELQKVDHLVAQLLKKKNDHDGGLVGAKKAVEAAKAALEAAHKELLESKSHVHRKEMD